MSEKTVSWKHFYPRPPRGGRRPVVEVVFDLIRFLSTPSARRATYKNNRCICAVAFLSTPSARRATSLTNICKIVSLFLSTPSARRATFPVPETCFLAFYFYPRPPRGGRQQTFPLTTTTVQFLSTPSARRATTQTRESAGSTKNFYPRPPRGGRRGRSDLRLHRTHISIHALREEGDTSTAPSASSW